MSDLTELSTRQLYLELHELQTTYGSFEQIRKINQEIIKRKLEEV